MFTFALNNLCFLLLLYIYNIQNCREAKKTEQIWNLVRPHSTYYSPHCARHVCTSLALFAVARCFPSSPPPPPLYTTILPGMTVQTSLHHYAYHNSNKSQHLGHLRLCRPPLPYGLHLICRTSTTSLSSLLHPLFPLLVHCCCFGTLSVSTLVLPVLEYCTNCDVVGCRRQRF